MIVDRSTAATPVTIRRMVPQDMTDFIRLANMSIKLHRPWIYAPTTPDEFNRYLSRFDNETAECWLIRIRNTDTIAGFATITEITRGPYQRGIIGYGAFAPSARQGYMTAGIELLIKYAFDELNLHRLEADIQPNNKASLKLVKRIGFRKEGFSPGFILIDGAWKDHERWAITSDLPERSD